jgi:hypothetical protein
MVRKRNEALIHATAWMSLENNILSEKQSQRSFVALFYVYEMFRIHK